ncbi:MAG: dihydroorotase [Ruminococcaceae bacterium]|nr:dihydroorotase [Oscillospiraceae bacterium]
MAYVDGVFAVADIVVRDGIIADVIPAVSVTDEVSCGEYSEIVDCSGKYIVPGFADVHVHLREPGFSYKETIRSGTEAAAAGGYTTVLAMPNLSPAPDCMENLALQLEAIERDACIDVLPYGCITVGEKGQTLADMAALAPHVAGFSDDGKGVQSREMMLEAMRIAKALDKPIAAHCEDESLLHGGYIHDGRYAREHGHKGICSESEWGPIARDIEMVRETGCRYHVCHVSAKESVEIIRKAKQEGLPVTCETGPHYLTLCDDDLQEDGRFKMNPPLRSGEDMKALLEGILDGTIDCIATDHAPHAAEEKSKGLAGSVMGIVGLETAFPVLYTKLVREQKLLTLERLIELMSVAPRRIFSLGGGRIEKDAPADIVVLDCEESYTIDPESFRSMGRSTPFTGMKVYGRCVRNLRAERNSAE